MLKPISQASVSVVPQGDFDEWKHRFVTLYLEPRLTKINPAERLPILQEFEKEADYSHKQGDSIAAIEGYVLLKLKRFFSRPKIVMAEMVCAADMYLDGECGVFAVALARFFGPPAMIYIMSRKNGEKWSKELPYEVTHAFVMYDRKTYDVKGQRDLDAMAKDFDMNSDGYIIKGPYNEQNFKLYFLGNSDTKPLYGSEQDIKEASGYIKKNIEKFSVPAQQGAYPVSLKDVDSMHEYEKDQIDRFFERANGSKAGMEVFQRKIVAAEINNAEKVKKLRLAFKANFIALRHEDNLQTRLNKCVKVFNEQVALLKSSK